MRTAVLAFALLITVPAQAAEKLPTFPKNTGYGDARTSLQALGWNPAPVPAADRYCTIGREDVCERYPETVACSGTGRALCSFTWKRGGSLIEVTTQGEEVDHLGVLKIRCRAGC